VARGEKDEDFMMEWTRFNTRTGFPASTLGVKAAYFFEKEWRGRRVGRYPGWRGVSIAFPGALFQARPVALCDGSGISSKFVRLPLRGQRRLAQAVRAVRASCFPLNCGM
jgi:hypothetical protein